MTEISLHPLLVRNLAQMGYAQPRPIQSAVRQPILEGRDVIGLAQTGTGKTAAFAAPILHHLLSKVPGRGGSGERRPITPGERLRALVLCPTRELAQQVQRETARIAQGSALRTACAYGKSAITPQVQAIARGVDVLVATTGRAIELLDDGHLSLAHVRHVVIDEGDRMMDMGFLPQVEKILQRVPEPRQIMLFSATMPRPMEDLARKFLREPARIEMGKHTTPVAHVKQRLIPVADDHKVDLLLHLLGDGHKQSAGRKGILIFCRTRRRVGWVGTALERNGIKAGMIHGDRSQAQRQKALDQFSEGRLRVLVATDVAARGLHIPVVSTVINYDLPMQPEEYVHRIGRAAHGMMDEISGDKPEVDSRGQAITLLAPDDRVKWRAVVDATSIEVFAEHVEGWSPPPPKRQQQRRGSPASADGEGKRKGEHEDETRRDAKPTTVRGDRKSRHDPFNRPPRKRGRSHASKPIKRGERPGGGVKRVTEG